MYSHRPSLAPSVHTCICHMHHMQMSIFQLGVKKSIVYVFFYAFWRTKSYFGVKVLAENGAGVTKMTNITATICFFSPLSKQAFKCWTSTTTVCANLLHRDGFLRLSMTGSFFFKASRCTPLTLALDISTMGYHIFTLALTKPISICLFDGIFANVTVRLYNINHSFIIIREVLILTLSILIALYYSL